MLEKQVLSYTEHLVERGPYHIYAREYPGEEPAIVLMHGFPDTMHLYDRLLPWLITSRRVVTFDFARRVSLHRSESNVGPGRRH